MAENNSKSFTCGTVYQSQCVDFTGVLPNFMLDKEKNQGCSISVSSVLEQYGEELDTILAGMDFTTLDVDCLDFDPDTVTLAELEALQIAKICEHEVEISAVQSELSNLNIGASLVELDLDCLVGNASECEDAPGTYSLLSILITFRNAICDLRDQVEECCLSGSNNGTSGTSGASGTSGSSGTTGTNGANGTSGTSGSSGTSGELT